MSVGSGEDSTQQRSTIKRLTEKTCIMMMRWVLISGGLRLFEGQGRKEKKGTYCTTWNPISEQKAIWQHP